MTINDITNFEEIDDYITTVRPENLTDEEIKELHKKILEIRDAKFQEIDSKDIDAMSKMSLKAATIARANDLGYYLGRCTPDKKWERIKQIQEAIKEAGRRETLARERTRMLD